MNVFVAIGLIEAAAGIVLLGIGPFVDGARIALLATGGGLLLSGGVFIAVGRKVGDFRVLRPGVLDTGVAGQGLITRMWETSVTVNSRPVIGYEMEITADGYASFTGSVQQATPRMFAGAILPGAVLAVHFAADDPTDLAIDFTVPPAPATTSGGGLPAPGPGPEGEVDDTPAGGMRRDADELLRSGRRGTAQVVAVRDMGTLGDLGMATRSSLRFTDHLFYMELSVKLPGGQPYTATVAHRVPSHQVGTFGPGREVPVAVDRDDERRAVAIDWDGVAGSEPDSG